MNLSWSKSLNTEKKEKNEEKSAGLKIQEGGLDKNMKTKNRK